MRILIIGGTGNISTDCAALLHQQGHEICLLTRGRTPVPAEYTAIQADRKDPASMAKALKGKNIDVAIDFIAYELGDVQTDFELFSGQVSQYLFISTTMVYARPAHFLPMTEDHPHGNPFSDYAQKKIVCEAWLREKQTSSGFPITIVRPSHTYSQRWIPNVVTSSDYTFAARLEQGKPTFIPGDGTIPWTLTASSDFAVGLAGLVGNPRAIGEAFHITGDERLTWNEIYREIAAALEVKEPVFTQVPIDFICEQFPVMVGKLKGDKGEPGLFDNSKIKSFVPEFRTRKTFREGIRECVAWFRQHPEAQTISPQMDEVFEGVCRAWNSRGSVV